MLPTILIAGFLVAIAIATYWWQVKAFQRQDASEATPFEADFYRRRHYRRSRISLLMAVAAVAMMGGVMIVDPLVTALFWLGVLCLLTWIVLLALLDASASHAYFARLRSKQLAEQAAWQRDAIARRRKADQ